MSTHNLCFRAKIRKNVYPCSPQFHYIKVGYKSHEHVILMKGMKTNTVYLDETAHYETTHLDLHCLQILLQCLQIIQLLLCLTL